MKLITNPISRSKRLTQTDDMKFNDVLEIKLSTISIYWKQQTNKLIIFTKILYFKSTRTTNCIAQYRTIKIIKLSFSKKNQIILNPENKSLKITNFDQNYSSEAFQEQILEIPIY